MSFKPFSEADNSAEEQSRIAELQLTRFSLENAGDAIFWIGEDSRLFYVNQAACCLLGYSRKELLSMTIHDISPLFLPEKWSELWQRMKPCQDLLVLNWPKPYCSLHQTQLVMSEGGAMSLLLRDISRNRLMEICFSELSG